MAEQKIAYWKIEDRRNPFLVLPSACYGCDDHEQELMMERIRELNDKNGFSKYFAKPVYFNEAAQ